MCIYKKRPIVVQRQYVKPCYTAGGKKIPPPTPPRGRGALKGHEAVVEAAVVEEAVVEEAVEPPPGPPEPPPGPPGSASGASEPFQ